MTRARIPDLKIDQIKDPVIRDNFRALREYISKQNQFNDFVHIEFKTTSAENNKKISHGLGFKPKDVILGKIVGSGTVTFNYSKFDSQYIDITTNGPVRVRAFVGTYVDDKSREEESPSETQQFKATV